MMNLSIIVMQPFIIMGNFKIVGSALIIMFFLYLLPACSTNTHDLVNDTVVYESSRQLQIIELTPDKIFGVVSKQQVIFSALIKNIYSTGQKINVESSELIVGEGSRSLPITYEIEKAYLLPGEESFVKIVYHPIASRKLFQETLLRGDLEEKYQLNFTVTDDDGNHVEERLFLLANREELFKEISNNGLKDNVIPMVIDKIVLKQPISTAMIDEKTNAVDDQPLQQNGNEILQRGTWIKFSGRVEKDSLLVQLRLVNQSGQSLKIKGSDLKIFAGLKELMASNANHGLEMDVENGGRRELTLKYVATIPHFYKFSLEGIQLLDSKSRLYTHDLLIGPFQFGTF